MASRGNQTDAELYRRLSRPRPAIVSPDRPWLFAASVAAILLLGLVMFLSMSSARTARQARREAAVPAAVQNAPVPTPPIAPSFAAQPAAPAQPAGPAPLVHVAASSGPSARELRLHAPAMIVDLSQPATAVAALPAQAEAGAAPVAPPGAAPKLSADETFSRRVRDSTVETSVATRLADTALIAPQGTIIPGILETGINSDTPGYVRAVVTRDVRGFDGSTVLIPRGSKLIGEYKSGVAQGASRAFVVWSRLLTPQGVSIELGSPAVDSQGRGGVKGETNSHFLKRFGGAILLSVLNAGLEAGANAAYGNADVVIGSPTQATSAASVALQRDLDIPPTITVRQGTPIRAFVARDLDFSGVMTASAR